MNSKTFYIGTQITLFYSVGVGIFYLWGYWKSFDIDILPYLSLWDITKFSAYPLFLTMISLAISTFIGSYTTVPATTVLLENNFPKNSSKFAIGKIIWFVIVSALAIIAIIFKIWIFVYPIVLMIIIAGINKIKCFSEIANSSSGKLIIYFITVLPFMSYARGQWNADLILQNREYPYTVFTIENQPKIFKFLGQLNEHYFFLSLNNQEVLIKNRLDTLMLKACKNTKP